MIDHEYFNNWSHFRSIVESMDDLLENLRISQDAHNEICDWIIQIIISEKNKRLGKEE